MRKCVLLGSRRTAFYKLTASSIVLYRDRLIHWCNFNKYRYFVYRSLNKFPSILFGGAIGIYIFNEIYNSKIVLAETPARVIQREDVSKHKTKADGIWVIYNGKVYDITQFVNSHPGGEKIMLAAGGDLEPFFDLYAFHKKENVQNILKEFYIGDLDNFQEEKLKRSTTEKKGPYADEPKRHPALIVNTETPFNSETPLEILVEHLFTPNSIFFIRNHLPVPKVDYASHKLELNIPFSLKKKFKFWNKSGTSNIIVDRNDSVVKHLSVEELKKKFTRTTICTTIQCAGNRRSEMQQAGLSEMKKRITQKQIIKDAPVVTVHGLSWGQGAISTAQWTGARLIDVLADQFGFKPNTISSTDLLAAARQVGILHVQFEGMDRDPTGGFYGASIPIEMALDPENDVIIAYEMNGTDIPLDHGYPLRAIIPGVIGARQVKWLAKISLSGEESSSFWQRNDYKFIPSLPEGVKPDFSQYPAIMDTPVQSAICEPRNGQRFVDNDGVVTVKGYAWSGGGRGIMSVCVSADGGVTWHQANLKPANSPDYQPEASEAGVSVGSEVASTASLDSMNHRRRKQWAWSLWEVDVPIVNDAKHVELLCKAQDSSNAVQPETFSAIWNVRGLMSNAWHRINIYFD